MDEDRGLWGEWLQLELERQNISVRKMSRDTGISRDTIKNWINKKGEIKISLLLKVLDYLGYDLNFRRRKHE